MIDLTQYNDNELSLVVYNDEGLYDMRRDSDLISVLEEYYIFTDTQLAKLIKDLSYGYGCLS